MLRLACTFACLAVTLGRRHTEHLDPVQTDMESVKEDVEQVENAASQVLDSVFPDARNDKDLIPLSASLQIAPTMEVMPTKSSVTLFLTHVKTGAAPNVSVVVTFTAKNEAGATEFGQALQGLLAVCPPSLAAAQPQWIYLIAYNSIW